MRLKLLYTSILFLLLTACGLNYATVPTPINQSGERRKAINVHLTEMFAKDSLVYADMAWGKTKTIKPLSYKQLDSLYAIKYNLERQGKRDTKLEDNIKTQRYIAQNDTSPVLYLEDHLFSVTRGDTMSVYSATIETDKEHTIRNADIHSSTNLDAGMLEEYKIYTFEESFVNRGFLPEFSEQSFYQRYKGRANELSGEAKDAFINHTLHLMQRARSARSLVTKPLIEEVIREEIHQKKRFPSYLKNEVFETMEELVAPDANGKNVVTGYQIVYSCQTVENGMTTSLRYFFQLSPYLEIEKMAMM